MRRPSCKQGGDHRARAASRSPSTATSRAVPNGYANAPKLGAAQNTALKHCYKYGGKDCVIRAWICDGKKG